MIACGLVKMKGTNIFVFTYDHGCSAFPSFFIKFQNSKANTQLFSLVMIPGYQATKHVLWFIFQIIAFVNFHRSAYWHLIVQCSRD